MKKIEDMLEKIDTRLDNMDMTLVKQEANLAEHMRRTEILESELRPLKSHVDKVKGGIQLIKIIGSTLVVFALILKLMGKI